jgi:plasmid stabilization system protein ParE
MTRYLLSDLATADIREIIEYIRERSPQGARRVESRLRSAMLLLASFPNGGHRRDDLTDEPLRFWTVHSYVIAYRPNQRPIEIVRILHGARDLRALFQPPK